MMMVTKRLNKVNMYECQPEARTVMYNEGKNRRHSQGSLKTIGGLHNSPFGLRGREEE